MSLMAIFPLYISPPRAKIADLQVQLEAQQLKLLEQAVTAQSSAQTPTPQACSEHLCSRCGRSLSTTSIDASSNASAKLSSPTLTVRSCSLTEQFHLACLHVSVVDCSSFSLSLHFRVPQNTWKRLSLETALLILSRAWSLDVGSWNLMR